MTYFRDMKRNVGQADRWIRLIVAGLMMYFSYAGFKLYMENFLASWELAIFLLGIVMFLTSLVGFCPLYAPLGLCSIKNQKSESAGAES